MAVPTAADLLHLWEPGAAAPPGPRLTALLTAVSSDAIDIDTLGQRNRRLLAMQQALVGGAIEAHVLCQACATDNEFVVPAAAILDTPEPSPGSAVEIAHGEARYRFRVPTMADLDAAGQAGAVADTVLARCRLAGPATIPPAIAAEVERQFDALDPAANIVVDIACAGCGAAIVATVDIAQFVARDLDRLVDGLMRDIDVIASAYGWDEPAVLALPPGRRRRYVAMIASRRVPLRALAGERR